MKITPKSPARLMIEQRFAEGTPGEELQPSMLQALCGLTFGNAYTAGYRVAFEAADWIERNHGLCWRYIRETHAWKCLKDDEKVKDCDARRKVLTRRAKRNKRIINTIDFANLSPAEQARAAANFIAASAIETLAHGRSIKKIEAHAERGYIPSEHMLLEICKARRNGS